jgi:putative hydrolase of the HAD superfamily
VKALMVDVDGVIVHPAHAGGWAERLEADLGLPVAALQDHFFKPHWSDVMLGRADLHDRLGPVLATIAPHLTSHQLAEYWFAHDARLDETLLADLAQWRAAGFELHLATVQEHHRARHLWETLGLSDRFDALHYAADLGCAKPDPAFFRAIEVRTGFAPCDLVLIDDRPANVEGAQACGWRGVTWHGTCTLGNVLGDLGLVLR